VYAIIAGTMEFIPKLLSRVEIYQVGHHSGLLNVWTMENGFLGELIANI
jgi:hypothetical protein